MQLPEVPTGSIPMPISQQQAIIQAKAYRAPKDPALLVEAALKTLTATHKLAATVRAKDMVSNPGAYSKSNDDKIAEELLKEVEEALDLLRNGLA